MIKRNNPFNVKYSSRNNWQGQIGQKNGFCVFANLEDGVRAGVICILRNLEATKDKRHELYRLDKMVARFAPPFENYTELYISFVKRYMEEHPYNSILFQLFTVCEAMCKFECGILKNELYTYIQRHVEYNLNILSDYPNYSFDNVSATA